MLQFASLQPKFTFKYRHFPHIKQNLSSLSMMKLHGVDLNITKIFLCCKIAVVTFSKTFLKSIFLL